MNKNLKNKHNEKKKMYLTKFGMSGIIPPTRNHGISLCGVMVRKLWEKKGNDVMMSEKKIKLTELDEVKEFVRAAEQCDFDIDVFYNRVIIDAKSILGVLSMDLTRELTVKYGGENLHFENILNKYAAA